MKHLMRSFKRLSRIACIALVAVHVVTTVKAMEPTGVPPSTSTRVPSLRQMAEVSILNYPEPTVDQTNSTNRVPSLRVMAKCAIREMILEKRMFQKITEEVAKQLIPPLVCSASDLAFASLPMPAEEFNSLPDLPDDEFPADWNPEEVERFEIKELVNHDTIIAIEKSTNHLYRLARGTDAHLLNAHIVNYQSLGRCKDFTKALITSRLSLGLDWDMLFEYDVTTDTREIYSATNLALPYGLSEQHNVVIRKKPNIDTIDFYNMRTKKTLLIVPDFGYMIWDKQMVIYDFEHVTERGYALTLDLSTLFNAISRYSYSPHLLPLIMKSPVWGDHTSIESLKNRIKGEIDRVNATRSRSNPKEETEIQKTVEIMVLRGILNKLDPIHWQDPNPARLF